MSYDKDQGSIQQLGYLLAEASKNVVFIIGAGLSVPAGIPDWETLNSILKKAAIRFIEKDHTVEPEAAQERIDRLQAISDPWILGDELESIIPEKEYINIVKESLADRKVPLAYELIWSLKPSGAISFNLDELAARALGGSFDQVGSAIDNSKYERFLILSRPFLLQPHGTLSNPRSWVLGTTARNRLLKNESYRRFIAGLLQSRRLVIAGFRPADFSFETLLLDDFRSEMTRGVEHFWIAPNPTEEQKKWARNYSITIISYSPDNEKHEELDEILFQLSEFCPRTPETGIAYKGEKISLLDLPSDEQLRTRSIEDIRRTLNAALSSIAQDESLSHDQRLSAILIFFKNYSGSVHMAWHIKVDSSYDTVWGARVEESVGSGAFGGVWKAIDPVDGRVMALKVLHENIVHEPDFLEAFRRGVRAMEILSNAKVPGMVRYIKAYDIPACVFMEYLNGLNFADAIESKKVESFDQALGIVDRAARIVLSGHELDKHVLHRDLKPSNIMLPNIYSSDEKPEIIVLDFDLSWYEGAMGKSMMAGTRLHNYVAPEQLVTRRGGYSSRHTAVDVFGLGMLLYFASTKENPPLNVQNTENFVQNTAKKISDAWHPSIKSAASYLALVIQEATYDRQEKRLGLPSLIDQIELVRTAIIDNAIETPNGLAVLEIAFRMGLDGWKYKYEMNNLNRVVLTKGNASISIQFHDQTKGTLFIAEIGCAMSGTIERKNIQKYLGSRCGKAVSILKRELLFYIEADIENESALILAKTSSGIWDLERLKEIAARLNEAASNLSFE